MERADWREAAKQWADFNMDGKSMDAATGTQKKYYRLATKHHLSCLDFLLQTETGQGLSQFVPADRLEALKKAPLDLVCFLAAWAHHTFLS